ncbi:MAG: GlsB/YeaQ/YmgE family stress response membrane protein [Acidobacteria bacterium]|nr:GlsB/YeaQ/YmgE family stress response membrane protein [Acidobacteriota bacterium]
MFGIIGTIISGLVVGVIAKVLMPGKDPGGFVMTILLGIAGSFLGGWGGRALGLYGEGESAGFIMSVLGSIALLFAYRMMKARQA